MQEKVELVVKVRVMGLELVEDINEFGNIQRNYVRLAVKHDPAAVEDCYHLVFKPTMTESRPK